ncbi:MAG: hypothetical protein ACP5TO_07710 [Thermoplasmata archaeon]
MNLEFTNQIIQNKYPYIYYAHSIAFYGTNQEKKDIEFLQNIMQVVNPKEINAKDISDFIKLVLNANQVWYRGYTAGVCLEVIVSLLKNIPVYSIETKLPISVKGKIKIIEVYRKTNQIDHDRYMLSTIKDEAFANSFLNFIIKGDTL